MSSINLVKWIKNEYYNKVLIKAQSLIKRIPIDGKCGNFIFINANHLSQEERRSLEQRTIKRQEFKYILKYNIKGIKEEVIVIKLVKPELYKLDDILLSEIIGNTPGCNYSDKLMREFLRTVHPQPDRWYKVLESRLDFCVSNYYHAKDKEAPFWQSFLDGYKYIIDRAVGNSFLDVGSCSGVLPLLLKLKGPEIEVTASDIRMEYFKAARDYCSEYNLKINFILLDILKPRLQEKFDTVVSVHVLEHFAEQDNITVIRNHLELANKEVILVVPFEESLRKQEHKQILNKEKMETIMNNIKVSYKIEKLSGSNYGCRITL